MPMGVQHLFGYVSRQIGGVKLLPLMIVNPRTVAGNQIALQTQLRHDRLRVQVVTPGSEGDNHLPFNQLL
ncbi:hypothetical protein D3C76_1578650 [compost metagenome]